jgi:hypothetical protein
MDQTKEMSPPSIKVPNWAICKLAATIAMDREVYPIQGHVRRAAILVYLYLFIFPEKNFFCSTYILHSTRVGHTLYAQKLSDEKEKTPCLRERGTKSISNGPS